MSTVPFLRPDLPPWSEVVEELRASYEAGRFHPWQHVARAEEAFAHALGVRHALLLSTASDGLILLMALLREGRPRAVRPFVAVPAFTFRATPQAVAWAGCDMIVVDCDGSGNMDPEALRSARLRYPIDAVLAVHVFGLPCDHAGLQEAVGANVPIYYDAAHAMGAEVMHSRVAGFGRASVYSLNITKTVPSCGEGGLFCTDDDALADQMRQARWHGDVPGSLDWTLPGMNAKPTEWQGIVAYHALHHMPEVIARRRDAVARYVAALGGVADCLPLQTEPPGTLSAWKDFAVRLPSPDHRARVEAALHRAGVEFKRYFHPITSKMRAFNGIVASDAVAQALADTVLCLPIYSRIAPDQQAIVVDAIRDGLKPATYRQKMRAELPAVTASIGTDAANVLRAMLDLCDATEALDKFLSAAPVIEPEAMEVRVNVDGLLAVLTPARLALRVLDAEAAP